MSIDAVIIDLDQSWQKHQVTYLAQDPDCADPYLGRRDRGGDYSYAGYTVVGGAYFISANAFHFAAARTGGAQASETDVINACILSQIFDTYIYPKQRNVMGLHQINLHGVKKALDNNLQALMTQTGFDISDSLKQNIANAVNDLYPQEIKQLFYPREEYAL